ncbi:CBS domain-containing protein [Arthrobacter sp. ISL-30]|uniref:CBS domain-containing protein n=1 Tax=Arthrobacter sp. ISL-30 TaxID=2819109 RepID=UPI001BE5CF6C|nr:CBS domain-containing protein [Arthrobacter sp. ISL-30]MBT2514698.1 hypothetical protein [Arthrobacter sp. ISL-30]
MSGTDEPHNKGQARQLLVKNAMVTVPKTLGPLATVDQVRLLFRDDHVHMALIVDIDGRLITTIDRSDIPSAVDGTVRARVFGALAGRTTHPDCLLTAVTFILKSTERRRLAVT